MLFLRPTLFLTHRQSNGRRWFCFSYDLAFVGCVFPTILHWKKGLRKHNVGRRNNIGKTLVIFISEALSARATIQPAGVEI
jgi:hypothetical protein